MIRTFLQKWTLILLLVLIPARVLPSEDSYPPFYIEKLSPGEQLVPFTLRDLTGKTYTNSVRIIRPFLFIKGKWALRHDVRKWAEYLSIKYATELETIWVFNPSGTVFANHRDQNADELSKFRMPVPVVIDSHSLVGRSLKVTYDIPTLIGINRFNQFMFQFEGPFSAASREELDNLIRTRLLR